MKRSRDFLSGTLYLVATPIGNLSDISSRVKETLSSVDFIASEDTRTTEKILAYLGIHKPMIACHEHNEQEASNQIINLLKGNKNVALTSDAGYPAISDPGAILVRRCIEENVKVSVIPGPNAALNALAGSNIDTSHFYFHGFLNSNPSVRKKELADLKSYKMTLIFYESPHRIKKTLNDLYSIFGNRKITLARELTKMFEEYIYGTLEELASIDETSIKGEMVLVVEGNKEELVIDDNIILEEAKNLSSSYSLKDIAKILSDKYNLKKNYVYDLLLKKGDF